MSERASIAIGIDLGTTNSAVAAMIDGQVTVLKNNLNEYLTPSVVGIDPKDNSLLVGRSAKEFRSLAPDCTAATFKRGMGRGGKFKIRDEEYGAVELSAMVLRRLVEDASDALGFPVDRCVITVPAYFDEDQRFATIKAGELAGLEVERILNEPTAAAMAYGLHNADRELEFLVFDLGGGTLDVCVMELFEGVLQVKSTAGESYLGGEDFTQRLAVYALDELGLSFEEIEFKDLEAYGRLIRQAELAKRKLSLHEEVEFTIPVINGMTEKEIKVTLSLEQAKAAWKPLLDRIAGPIRAALRGAALRPSDLDEVILVGGATRMPCVRELVKEILSCEPLDLLDTDLAVVQGAAVQASLCVRDQAVEDLVVTDVISHSMGVNITKVIGNKFVEGFYSPVIHRNTVIPTSRTEPYETIFDNQTSIVFEIFEGESRRVTENRKIGELKIKGIPKGPKGKRVDVTFTYDLNGILEVEATINETGRTLSEVFQRGSTVLSASALEKAKKRLQKLKEDPHKNPVIRDLLLRAENLWRESTPDVRSAIEHALDTFEEIISSKNPRDVQEAVERLQEFCDELDEGERW